MFFLRVVEKISAAHLIASRTRVFFFFVGVVDAVEKKKKKQKDIT